MSTTITADTDTKSFDIKAAIEGLSRPTLRLMATANIGTPSAKIPVADLDRQLAGSRLNLDQRLQLKVGLERAGVLGE